MQNDNGRGREMKKGGGSGDRTTGNETNRGGMDKRTRLCSERRELRRAKE